MDVTGDSYNFGGWQHVLFSVTTAENLAESQANRALSVTSLESLVLVTELLGGATSPEKNVGFLQENLQPKMFM